VALGNGDIKAAEDRFARSLKICRDAEDKPDGAIALWCLGKSDVASGDYGSARSRLIETLRKFEAFEMNLEALDCLEDYAGLMQAVGEAGASVRLQAAATSIRTALGLPRLPRFEPKHRANVDAARAAVGDRAFNVAWSEGQEWAFDDAIEYAVECTTIDCSA